MSTAAFLTAMARGKHRKGAGPRLRKLVAEQEREQFGALACFCCARSVAVSSSTLEHIVAQSAGGKTVLANLALSHGPCNEQRGNSGSPRAAVFIPEAS